MNLNFLESFKNKSFIYNNDNSIKKGIYTFINSYSYFYARKNTHQLSQFSNIFADGFIFVHCYNFFFPNKKITRVSFDMTSIADEIFSYACQNNKSVYIIGANKTEIEKTVNLIKSKYQLLPVCGYRNGYFKNDKELEKTQNKILKLNPDIVIAGMGTPKQEEFLISLKNSGWNGIGFTCGGFLHQTSERLNYYPQWCDKYNLRWLYRLINEPHTRLRVLKTYSIFPFVFAYDYFLYIFLRNKVHRMIKTLARIFF